MELVLKGLAGLASSVAAALLGAGLVIGDFITLAGGMISAGLAAFLWWLASKNDGGGNPMNRDGGIDTGGGDIHAQNVAGRDINITQVSTNPPLTTDGWEDEPGAPRFRIHQGSAGFPDHVKQDMSFDQVYGDQVGGLRARYRAPGFEMDPTKPMDQNKPRAYQMKSATLPVHGMPDPVLGEGFVGFAIQFNWAGAERHILWAAPLRLHEKGFWRADWNAQPSQHWSVARLS